jgi:dienelactone hydrolase
MPSDPPFVLPPPEVARATHDGLDLYLPDSSEPAPAVLLIHGVPYGAEGRALPSEWGIYRGYASQLADRGRVATVVNHSPDGLPDDDRSNAALVAAITALRTHPRVDGERLALWFFSGAGPLASQFLYNPPSWLRCVALTYPVLGDSELVTVRGLSPVEAVAGAGKLPVVMTVVGRELPDVAPTQPPFVEAARAAGVQLQLIDVPNGRHGFDVLDHTDESRAAVTAALDAVTTLLA